MAEEALYNAEAVLRFLLDKDEVATPANLPPLAGDYKSKVLDLIVKAERAYDGGQYGKMRRDFYHALWIAYPVTSRAAFTEPKD